MDSKRNKMLIDTYNAYLTTQYYFRAHGTDAVTLFSRKDPINDAVEAELCLNMENSFKANKS